MNLKRSQLLLSLSLAVIVPVTAVEAATNIYENYKQSESNQIQVTEAKDGKIEDEVLEIKKNLPVKVAVQEELPPPPPELTVEDYRQLYGPCGEYHDLAIAVGWSEDQWKKLSKIMYRESRCNTMSHNTTDPTKAGSRGLIQINGFWCLPNKYNPNGFLQKVGVLGSCDDLWNPELNLRAGLAIFKYSEDVNGDGWQPWRT